MVLRESEFSARAAEQTLPLQDAFAVLFFVSVGMLFDPRILVDEPARVLATVAVIVLGKSLAAVALVLILGYSARTALVVAASLAQLGEFSFILAGLGLNLGLLSKEGNSLILAGALISIAFNPVIFKTTGPLLRWLMRHPKIAARLDPSSSPLAELPQTTDAKYLANQVVLVGYGRIGRLIAGALKEQRIPYVVADSNRDTVELLRSQETPAVWGDATDPAVLIQAHIRDARALLITVPEAVHVQKMAEIARALNPTISVVVRGHNAEEAQRLEADGVGTVFVGERELAAAMTGFVQRLIAESPRTP